MRHGPRGKALLVFFADVVAEGGVAVFGVLGVPGLRLSASRFALQQEGHVLVIWAQVCLDVEFLDGAEEHEGGVPVEFYL